LPNTILKMRIDQFLSRNHESLEESDRPLKRVVGHRSFYNNGECVTKSRLIHTSQSIQNGQCSTDPICSFCDIKHDSHEQMYKLSCDHLICRDNWIKMIIQTQGKSEDESVRFDHVLCVKCKCKTLTKDVIKVYIK